MDVKSRLGKLRAALTEKGVDAVFISEPENRHYLSGFNGSAGYLLITGDTAVLATDFRYIEQAKAQAPDYEVFRTGGNIGEWFPRLLAGLGEKRLGFEDANITFAQYRAFSEALNKAGSGVKLVPLEGLAEPLRAVKDSEEIELIRQAIAITDAAFAYIESKLQAGMTELEAAWVIEKFMRESGSQPVPFEVIVASGPNAALPHARPSERPIALGESVVVDIGAKVAGYTSDMTRTMCPGPMPEKLARVYDIVLGAQLAALEMIEAGMTGGDADKLARTFIEEAGYGDAFGHGLGHGVGLATHESPRLGPGSPDRLAEGMVFTIEPGVYLPGWGGVRIEDMAVIVNGKAKFISKAKKVRDL